MLYDDWIELKWMTFWILFSSSSSSFNLRTSSSCHYSSSSSLEVPINEKEKDSFLAHENYYYNRVKTEQSKKNSLILPKYHNL
ncbi:hypothetical protein DERP_005948 [Dermatophagoides pteronyssinus]|uniref:Secreted protein n=1 Tax=Dermatophagoides pteronyssinus TaxID=6956 RepID=A0ABQ8JSI1_DERPT|nr:hypothetical protein DERP_005948 [Dermatophagoides pteronyssinus]